ncbi:MAG: hypothetical protein WC756_10485 [Taibaiella sp.]|jgi:hypothetical protein
MGKRIGEMDSATSGWAMQNINMHANNIWNMHSNAAERIIKILLFLSSGGVVTILAYISNTTKNAGAFCLSGSLIMFLLGLSIATFLVAYDYYVSRTYLIRFCKDYSDFTENKISFDQIWHFSSNRKSGAHLIWMGLICFFFIALGVTLGLCGYLNNTITV